MNELLVQSIFNSKLIILDTTVLNFQIFLGLHELLGKQIPVGDNNLSWSLVKSIKSDIHDTDEPDIDAIESYSRLNVALDVMHECFVPVKEPLTRRDLVEDIIFTRGWEIQTVIVTTCFVGVTCWNTDNSSAWHMRHVLILPYKQVFII